MRPKLAEGAQEIWDLRMSGKKPTELVFVSMIGELNAGNFQVMAPKVGFGDYDWRWVRDLSVCLVYDDNTPNRPCADLTRTLVRCAPNGGYTRFSPAFGYLWTWNATRQSGQLIHWWQGHAGIPEIGIEDVAEQIEIQPINRWEITSFEGVRAA